MRTLMSFSCFETGAEGPECNQNASLNAACMYAGGESPARLDTLPMTVVVALGMAACRPLS